MYNMFVHNNENVVYKYYKNSIYILFIFSFPFPLCIYRGNVYARSTLYFHRTDRITIVVALSISDQHLNYSKDTFSTLSGIQN